MVVTRKVSIKRHILAIILAVLIFLTGISLGAFVNTERTEQLEEKTELSKLDFDSLQVQYLFLTSSLETEKSCLAAAVTLEENVNLLEVLGNKLTKYIRDQVLTDEPGFRLLKREYTLAELRYWLFAEKFKEACDSDTVTILYFYSSDNTCSSCETQGVILDYLKGMFKDKLLNFALDSDFTGEPMINIIKNTYNITKTPTLIINNKKYEGFYSKEEITHIICPLYKDELYICEGVGDKE
ncbi:MAG: hypothetical protein KKA79_07820 [Nanoarchaeota archaeon]|nr:hypothetical protein [Nanoarchaeota archaeon]